MQIRPEHKKALIAAAGLLLAACVLWFAAGSRNHAFELRVDGELVGYVNDQSLVKSVSDSLASAESAKRGTPVIIASAVETVKATSPGEFLTKSDIENALAKALKYGQKGFVIQVNGKDAVTLATQADAEAAIAKVKAGFEETAKKNNAGVLSLQVLEEVKCVEKAVSVEDIKSLDDACTVLLRGKDQLVLYTVKKGDNLWTIARANDTTIDKLRAANPDLRGDRIDIGQKLNLTQASPFINVVTVERQVSDVKIGFRTEVRQDPDLWPWQSVVKQPGVYGKKEVTMEIKRQNGREIARTVLEEKHISDPSTQIVLQGSKMTAEMGTGSYAWPVTGQISSRYGQRRSGYHQGLDIAAPTGTSVYAADSGTVVIASYKAYYGNMIMIDHGGGKVITVYGHLSKIGVSVGDDIEKGQEIGKVGSTGRSTGPHLHFEVRVEGSTTNPITYYPIQK